jgi:hypothetical protein
LAQAITTVLLPYTWLPNAAQGTQGPLPDAPLLTRHTNTMAKTPILLDSGVLSSLVDAVLQTLAAAPGVSMPQPERLKSAALTACARTLRGPRADWGHITQAEGVVVAQGAERHAPLLTGLRPGTEIWLVQYDEREDWARAPLGPFTTRADALAAVAADTWWHAPDVDPAAVLAHLATHDRYAFFVNDGDDEGDLFDDDAQPYAIDLHRLTIPG